MKAGSELNRLIRNRSEVNQVAAENSADPTSNKHDENKQSCELPSKVVRSDTFGFVSMSSSLPTDNTTRMYEPKLQLLKKADSRMLDGPFSNLTNSSMVNSPTLDIRISESTQPVSWPIKKATKRLISFADR